MTVAIGPVKAKFKGNLRLADIDPPNAYTLHFDGQGGAAGFGKGSAQVTLTPEGGGTRLAYTVNAQIGGRIAQLGSRLVDGASKKMADNSSPRSRKRSRPAFRPSPPRRSRRPMRGGVAKARRWLLVPRRRRRWPRGTAGTPVTDPRGPVRERTAAATQDGADVIA
jgi:hypothetical protein